MKNIKKTHRVEKIVETIKAAVIEVLQRGKMLDRRLYDNTVTITNVKVSSDLKIATCYFVPFINNNISKEELIDALNVSKNAIRYQITNKINLKYSPEIRFIYDSGSENALFIDSLLSKIK